MPMGWDGIFLAAGKRCIGVLEPAKSPAMNPRVAAVTPLEGHLLLLTLRNGERRRLDVTPYLAYPDFERLREPGFFALAQADHGTVGCPGGIDLDPDSVYLESVPVAQPAVA
jgi:hypothetical protein